MIVGLGVDLTEVDRIEAAIERRGRPFLERLFTPAEIAYCETHRHRAERFAGRFAAKEAAMKALGTGWARGVRWVDIEIVREPGGKPTLKLSGTITHTGNTALALVIFEG
jgi:holo-[acyl-carrier protein] synthase